MEIKLFEVRDRATTIPMMAVALMHRNEAEAFLLRRSGYATEQIGTELPEGYERYVILVKLDGVEAQYDPYSWPGRTRTIPVAHKFIIENWSQLTSGNVVDVEFLLGERPRPKVSERLTHGDQG